MRESHEFRIQKRKELYEAQNGICGLCNRPIKGEPSLDHVIPLSLGAELYQEGNYICTCIRCNKAKGDRVIFTNLFDGLIYPIVDVPRFFRADYIQTNNFK